LQNHASLVFSNKVSQKAEDQDDDDDSSGIVKVVGFSKMIKKVGS